MIISAITTAVVAKALTTATVLKAAEIAIAAGPVFIAVQGVADRHKKR